MSDKHNSLEEYMVEKFKVIDKTAHRVSGSGSTDYQKSDISNKFAHCECKIKHTQENIIIKFKDEWQKTLDQMPINSNKFPLVAIENKFGQRFITLAADDFFELLYKANKV